jgi:Protein of unknown function (DUF2730)
MNLGWTDVAAMTAALSFFAGVQFWVLRGRFATIFVSRSELVEVEERLEKIETALRGAPTQEDFKGLSQDVSACRTGLAVAGERLSNVQGGMDRVERQLGLFIRARLEWEKQQ